MANQYRSVLASGGASTGGDALPAEVLSGKTFTNDNGAQTGTMTNNGAVSETLAAGASYTIPEGYHNGNGTVTASLPTTHHATLTQSAAGGGNTTVFSFDLSSDASEVLGVRSISMSGTSRLTVQNNGISISGTTVSISVINADSTTSVTVEIDVSII